jgi:hypothetical protein
MLTMANARSTNCAMQSFELIAHASGAHLLYLRNVVPQSPFQAACVLNKNLQSFDIASQIVILLL